MMSKSTRENSFVTTAVPVCRMENIKGMSAVAFGLVDIVLDGNEPCETGDCNIIMIIFSCGLIQSPRWVS